MKKLSAFLVKAKKATYASGNKATKLADGFEEFVFEDGEFRYRDRYHARDLQPFGGQEVVWQNGKAVWMMNYYGFMLGKKEDSEGVYGFLRRAMSLVSAGRPFRGPSEFVEGDFKYVDANEGDVMRSEEHTS